MSPTSDIFIVYAYEPEVKALKALVKDSNLQNQVRWHRWPSINMSLRGGRRPTWQSKLLLNIGFAGGLKPGLALGQVVLIDKIIALTDNGLDELLIDSPQQKLAKKYAEDNGLAPARLLTVSDPVTDSLLRDELSESTKADVVDMEGQNLFSLAKEQNTSFISFKVVTDNADSDTWQVVKQKGELWSKMLAEKVFDFIKECPRRV